MALEMTGTLYVFGIPVLAGMYATSAEEVQQWYARVPLWIQWATRMHWYMTWTARQDYRDATGECKHKASNVKLRG
jgi:hypothetical protein